MKNDSSKYAVSPAQNILATLPSIAFWGASTALTGYGAYRSFIIAIHDERIAFALAVMMTSALTASGFHLFRYAGAQKGKLSKPAKEMDDCVQIDATPKFRSAALAAGILVLFISSWFSFSSLVFLNFGDDLQRAMNEEIQAPLILPIRDLERSLGRIEYRSRELASVAEDRSLTEARDGGQCVSSPPGDGPITKMIADHATITSSVASEAAVLRVAAFEALDAIKTASNQSSVVAAYSKAQSVLTSGMREKIARSAERLHLGYSGFGFRRDGVTIRCPRGAGAMLPALDKVIAAAQAEIVLPTTPPIFREASLIDSAMWQLRTILTLGEHSIPGVSFWYILLFGIFAIFLDLSGAATAHLSGRLRGGCLSTKELQSLKTSSEIMENFIWDTPSYYHRSASGDVVNADFNTVLVMPTEEEGGSSDEIVRAVRRFVSAYGLDLDRTRTARSLSELPLSYQFLKRRLQRRGFSGDAIDVYTGSNEAWKRILKHRRILRLIFGEDAVIKDHMQPLSKDPDNITKFRREA